MRLFLSLIVSFLFLCVLILQPVRGIEEIKKKVMPSGLRDIFANVKSGRRNSQTTIKMTDVASFEDLGLTPPPSDLNDTIKQEYYTYYNSTFVFDPELAKAYWVDLDKMPQERVITHAMLSNSHRQATTVALSFEFPFYGNKISNITIATGGFLYTGDYLHSWIAATQYVAPLMANFDTRLSDESSVKYADNGTAFTVQWDKAHIQGRVDDGVFTFQVTLFKNGDIIFAYKDIPYSVKNISDDEHPVKIGISDAYIIERRVFFLRRKTIYEYHRIDSLKEGISNNTAIYFTALPTCLDYHTCEECLGTDEVSGCLWCDTVQRCSDGVDRQRQSWLLNECTLQARGDVCPSTDNATVFVGKASSSLPLYTSAQTKRQTPKTSSILEITSASVSVTSVFTEVPTYVNSTSNSSSSNKSQGERAAYSQEETEPELVHSVKPAIIVSIVIILALLAGLVVWIYYAYRNPHSSSGQFLIKYRPSQWKANKEDNTCTSPSVHI